MLFFAMTVVSVLAADDTQTIEGVWAVVRIEKDGTVEDEPGDTVLTVKDGIFLVKQNGKEAFKGKVEFDPKKETLDFLDDSGKPPLLGLYGVNKETLQVCFGAGDDRPAKFTASKGSGQTITMYKRK